MRASSMLCASLAALAALAVTADCASAATFKPNAPGSSDKATTVVGFAPLKPAEFVIASKIGAAPGGTEADCAKAHGTVTTNPDGSKTCVLPAGGTPSGGENGRYVWAPPPTPPSNGRTPAGSGFPACKIGATAGSTEADCAKARGTVTTNPDGSKTCVFAAGSTTGRSGKMSACVLGSA